jgi:hypothetical protein
MAAMGTRWSGTKALSGSEKLLIPVWHGVGADVRSYSPSLANIVALNFADGLEYVASSSFDITPTGI